MADAILNRIDISLDPAGQDVPLPTRTPSPTRPPRQVSRTGLDLALVTDFAAFEALEADWNALVSRSTCASLAFQTFNWNWHWARHYLASAGRRGPKLAIVTGRSAGRLALVLPLVTTRACGLTRLSWMGEPVSQYGDIVAAPEAANPDDIDRALAFAISATRADVLYLRKVRDDAAIAPVLAARRTAVTTVEEAPFMSLGLAPDFDTFEDNHGLKRKKNRRRQMRRLAERGTVEFERVTGTDAAASLADHAVQLKRASLARRGDIAPAFADRRFARFFADAVQGHGRPTGTSVMSIRSNGEIAAMQIFIDHAHHRFLHLAVFSDAFEKCGAGALLLEQAARDCYESGIDTFDLLCPKHEYKMDFADGTITVRDHALGVSTLGRFFVRAVLGFRSTAKNAIVRFPAPVRAAVGKLLARVNRND